MIEATPHLNPIEQFDITHLVPARLLGWDIAFTNAGAFMVGIVALISIVVWGGTWRLSLVPSRWQSIVEMVYEFVEQTVKDSAGKEAGRFFPFVFSLFIFILTANLVGLLPHSFTITSHFIVTLMLAMIVISTVVISGLYVHGLRWFKLFVPSGVPIPILILLIPIEVISFLSRPLSLSVRLFANMLAGHITLQVFGGFVVLLLGGGLWTSLLAPLPVVAVVAMYALELLVACLQAFVFSVLTCIYLHDALHPGH